MTYEILKDNAVKVEHTIRLSKPAIRSLQDDKVAAQMTASIASTITGARTARGWKMQINARHMNGSYQGGEFHSERDFNRDSAITGEWMYHVYLDAICLPMTARKGLDTEFQNILNSLDAKAKYNGGWAVTLVDGKPYSAADAAEKNLSGDVGYAPIIMPENFETHFSHLYGLDAQIARLKSALSLAISDGFRHRFHCALIGPPGCGKSDTCLSLMKAVGEDSVMQFDATSTTMAGAQKELAEREEMPRVMLIEEIEKVMQDASSAWLLSVLDLRGEIRKTTARSNILKDTRVFCVATVNDFETFKRLNFGALQSRFMHKIFYQRPSRELLERIIQREIQTIKGGRSEWCAPTLDYCEEAGISDPREVIAIALCGGDALLDGTYQEYLRKTSKPKWEENGQ
jgi:hypothetical protein